jgi:hypothetical protein
MDTKILLDTLKAWGRFADTLRAANYPDTRTPKARYSSHRAATRRGAVHHVGGHFYPRAVTMITLNTGESVHPTPALYRRLHLGDRKKVKAINVA